MKYYRRGKTVLCLALINQLGYSKKRSIRVVNQVVAIMKQALIDGKRVKIEGLGTLRVIKRPEKRVILAGTRTKCKTLYTINKRKTIVLQREK